MRMSFAGSTAPWTSNKKCQCQNIIFRLEHTQIPVKRYDLSIGTHICIGMCWDVCIKRSTCTKTVPECAWTLRVHMGYFNLSLVRYSIICWFRRHSSCFAQNSLFRQSTMRLKGFPSSDERRHDLWQKVKALCCDKETLSSHWRKFSPFVDCTCAGEEPLLSPPFPSAFRVITHLLEQVPVTTLSSSNLTHNWSWSWSWCWYVSHHAPVDDVCSLKLRGSQVPEVTHKALSRKSLFQPRSIYLYQNH
jgi:hypothetical protein